MGAHRRTRPGSHVARAGGQGGIFEGAGGEGAGTCGTTEGRAIHPADRAKKIIAKEIVMAIRYIWIVKNAQGKPEFRDDSDPSKKLRRFRFNDNDEIGFRSMM